MFKARTSKNALLHCSLAVALAIVACGGTAIVPGTGSAGSEGNGKAGSDGVPAQGGDHDSPAEQGQGGGPPRANDGPPVCDAPTLDPVTHLEVCGSGLQHRRAAVVCDTPVDPGTGGTTSRPETAGAGGGLSCKSDADCAGIRYGWCDVDAWMTGHLVMCRVGCRQDSDCETPGAVCACNGTGAGHCADHSGCQVDSDCGPSEFCAPTRNVCGSMPFQCTTRDDECVTDSDCQSGHGCFNYGEGFKCLTYPSC